MILNISIILLLILASVGVSIFSITGSEELHKRSLLAELSAWWGHKGTTSGNKWKNGNKSEGERFPFSSTLLSGFTDAWHTGVNMAIIGFSVAGILTGFQMAFNNSAGDIVQMIMLWFISYGVAFNLTHHYVLMDDGIPNWQIFVGLLVCLLVGALGLQFGLFDNGWIFLWFILPSVLYIFIMALLTIIAYVKYIIYKIIIKIRFKND